jgi:hypothetical protein
MQFHRRMRRRRPREHQLVPHNLRRQISCPPPRRQHGNNLPHPPAPRALDEHTRLREPEAKNIKQESSSFLKKRTKKLLLMRAEAHNRQNPKD